MKLHEVAPYVTDAFHGYPLASVYVSEAAFQALSPEDRGDRPSRPRSRRATTRASSSASAFEPEWEKVMAEGGKFQPLTDEAARDIRRQDGGVRPPSSSRKA